jgi:hypothetical protein
MCRRRTELRDLCPTPDDLRRLRFRVARAIYRGQIAAGLRPLIGARGRRLLGKRSSRNGSG